MTSKPRIAIAIGDPAGIGPEIAIKASLNRDVRDICDPVIVGDYEVLARYAQSSCFANLRRKTSSMSARST